VRITRTRMSLAAVGLAVAGAAAAVMLTADPAAAGPASGPAAAVPTVPSSASAVLVVCSGKGQVRPSVFDYGCMPSSEYLAKLRWTSWGSVAFGSGDLRVNNCTPTCAGGTYISYPILIVLWRAEPWTGHPGKDYFSRMTWIFTGKLPPRPHTTTQTFTLSPKGAP